MFDLEQAIADWRKQMLAAGIESPTPLEELEIHLREEIEQQMLSGLNPQKALEIARQKIGRIDALKLEFAKTNAAAKSAKWERQVTGLMAGVVIVLGTALILKCELNPGWRLAGFANFALLALAILGRRTINQLFPVIASKRLRTTVGLVFGFLSLTGIVIFMNFVLPNFELTEGQLTVVVLWSLTVMAILGAVWDGLEGAARKQIPIPD